MFINLATWGLGLVFNQAQSQSLELKDTTQHDILLLGDGFFARGFLHTINRNKFNVTQIYKDNFINPQDMMYSLQRNEKYKEPIHFRDFFYKKPDIKITHEIKSLSVISNDNIVNINNVPLNYKYLIIGLGAQKSLHTWKDQINEFIDDEKNDETKKKTIGLVGMGPVGIELGTILSNKHNVSMFDLFPEDKILNFVSLKSKKMIMDILDTKKITSTLGKPFNKNDTYDNVLFCAGSSPNKLTSEFKINEKLQLIENNKEITNIYIGGDCVNSKFIKTAQVAYQQGVYVAKRLNNEIPASQSFEYKSNGLALNIGDHNVLIEGHSLIKDGVYPDIIVRLYSLFFV